MTTIFQKWRAYGRNKNRIAIDILHQQIAVERETEQIRKEGEAIRQEVSELSTTNLRLKEQEGQ